MRDNLFKIYLSLLEFREKPKERRDEFLKTREKLTVINEFRKDLKTIKGINVTK